MAMNNLMDRLPFSFFSLPLEGKVAKPKVLTDEVLFFRLKDYRKYTSSPPSAELLLKEKPFPPGILF